METTILIAQFLLSAIFTLAGYTILFIPKEKLPAEFPFREQFSNRSVKFFGLANLLTAVGMFSASLSFQWNLLAPLSALTIGFLILAAIIYHSFKKKFKGLSVDALLLGVSAFVIYGYVLHYIDITYSIYQFAH